MDDYIWTCLFKYIFFGMNTNKIKENYPVGTVWIYKFFIRFFAYCNTFLQEKIYGTGNKLRMLWTDYSPQEKKTHRKSPDIIAHKKKAHSENCPHRKMLPRKNRTRKMPTIFIMPTICIIRIVGHIRSHRRTDSQRGIIFYDRFAMSYVCLYNRPYCIYFID